MAVFVDPLVGAPQLRDLLYRGNLVVHTRIPAVSTLVDHVRTELTALFAPHDPQLAHEHFGREELARRLTQWKPRFIHSPTARNLVRRIASEAGLPDDDTFYDVPKPRTAFPVGHLTSGIAYAFPWHRDTWYSAPAQQINWWLPVYPVQVSNSMGFDLASFATEVSNTSDEFDYYRNNEQRLRTGSQLTSEVQSRPQAPGHVPAQELVTIPAPGSVLLFSGAQLHRSIPNTSARSRFSVDFRTVDLSDLRAGLGAPMVDVRCSGTAVRDFRRVSDEGAIDEGLVRQIFGTPPAGATLVFSPPH